MDRRTLRVVAALNQFAESQHEPIASIMKRIIVQALSEVIDGPRTGRASIAELEKTEKTYIGTKIEIVARAELGLKRGAATDVIVDGIPVDIKWSKSLQWMIGLENIGQVCLGFGLHRNHTAFSVGIFRPVRGMVRRPNRDTKVSLTAAARRTRVHWIVQGEALEPSFLAKIPAEVRKRIFEERSAQDRIRRLILELPETPIPREAFETVALGNRDAMRRLRQDAHNPDALGGWVLLSTKYGKDQLGRLGFTDVPKDHWVAVAASKLSRTSARRLKNRLGSARSG